MVMKHKYLNARMLLYITMLGLTVAALIYQMRRMAPSEVVGLEVTGRGRDWDNIAARQPLIIATDYGATSSNHDEKEMDYLYRLTQYITRRTGVEVALRLEARLDNLLPMLEAGEIDVLAGQLPRTSEIDTARFAWTRPRLIAPVLLAQRSDTTMLIRSQIDLAGKTIALPEGSAYRLFVEHLSQEMGVSIHTAEYPEGDTEDLLRLLQAGEIDYTLCSAARAEHYAALYPDLDISLPVTYSLRSGWLVRRSSVALQDSLALWIKRFR